VYRAHDVELDRPVALKILDVSATSTDSRLDRVQRRFRNEVEALSRIRNPHVINIHESMMLEGGVPAMLTEFIEGRTLGEIIDDAEEIELNATLVLAHQIANGLHEAHLRGVIHRDIKPDNVIVEQLPASGWFARLLDFGLVHLVDTKRQTRGFQGTPLYAAPEQCRDDEKLTPAADIYSLGCVMFSLVTGRPPFDYQDARALIFAHVDEAAPDLSEVADRDIPPELDALVDSMLQKAPGDRPDDLSHVAGELEALIQGLEGARSSSVSFETGGGLEESTSSLHPETSFGLNRDDSIADSFAEHEGDAPDTRRLAQLVQFVDLRERYEDFRGPIVAATIDGEGDCAAVSDAEGGVYATSVRGERFCERYRPADTRVMSLTASSRIGCLFGVTETGVILRWELARPNAPPERVLEIGRYVIALDTDPRGQKLYWVTDTGKLWRRDSRLDRVDVVCNLPASTTHLEVADDGSTAVTAGSNGEVRKTTWTEDTADSSTFAALDAGVDALFYANNASVTLVVCDDGSLYGGRVDEDDLQLLDSSVTKVRDIGVTGDLQIVGLGVRGETVQTWRLRYEKFERRLSWFEKRSSTKKTRMPRERLAGDQSE
jgi:serine/threonine protein kinase